MLASSRRNSHVALTMKTWWSGMVLNTMPPHIVYSFTAGIPMLLFKGYLYGPMPQVFKAAHFLVELSPIYSRQAGTWKLIAQQCLTLIYDRDKLRRTSVPLTHLTKSNSKQNTFLLVRTAPHAPQCIQRRTKSPSAVLWSTPFCAWYIVIVLPLDSTAPQIFAPK